MHSLQRGQAPFESGWNDGQSVLLFRPGIYERMMGVKERFQSLQIICPVTVVKAFAE